MLFHGVCVFVFSGEQWTLPGHREIHSLPGLYQRSQDIQYSNVILNLIIIIIIIIILIIIILIWNHLFIDGDIDRYIHHYDTMISIFSPELDNDLFNAHIMTTNFPIDFTLISGLIWLFVMVSGMCWRRRCPWSLYWVYSGVWGFPLHLVVQHHCNICTSY